MKIDIERLETCELALTIEVDSERWEAAMKAAARRLAEKYKIPGFRKGKAPYQLILRQFGEETVRNAAVEELGPRLYEEALDQARIDPYAAGSLTDVGANPPVFKFTVPLKPEVELGNYRSLRMPYAVPPVTDQALAKALEHLREHHVVLEPVERPAQPGDVVTTDVVGTLSDNAAAEPLLDDHDVNVLIDEKTAWPLPGFSERLVGITSGEVRQIDLSFPADFDNERLRGRPAHFIVTASAVKSRFLPEWSDDLAKEMGEFETLLDLRLAVRQQLQENTERAYSSEYAQAVKDIVVAGATAKSPPILLEREIENLQADLDRRLREQNLNLEDYLKMQKRTRESLRDELRPAATERLKRALVLGKVVEVEGLDLEAGEVEQKIQTMTKVFGDDGPKINKILSTPTGQRSVAIDLLADKAVERLVAIAKGEAMALPTPESTAVAAAPKFAAEAPAPAPEPSALAAIPEWAEEETLPAPQFPPLAETSQSEERGPRPAREQSALTTSPQSQAEDPLSPALSGRD